MLADMLIGRVELDAGFRLGVHHHPVDAHVDPTGQRVLGDDGAHGPDETRAVPLVPVRRGEYLQIHIVAFEDVVLDRARLDDAGRDMLRLVIDSVFQRADDFVPRGISRVQPQHHRRSEPGPEGAGEQLVGAGGLIILDVLKQQGR